MYSGTGNHGPSLLMMNCGHNLPGCPVLSPQLWNSAFLPATYQGTHLITKESDPQNILQNIRNAKLTSSEQERQLLLLDRLNQGYLLGLGHGPKIEASIAAMELAYRMRTDAPEILDITKEPEKVRARYGDHEFGRGCLMALRMAKKGVRIVEVYFGNFQFWDSHDEQTPPMAR